jgi:hypothetical protein
MMKKYMEASLDAAVDNGGREDFLEYGRRVLQFSCEWLDEIMFDETNFYTLHYFIADQSIEIPEKASNNSGRDPFPKLMNRQKARKEWQCYDAGEWYHDENPNDLLSCEDLQIGGEVNVFGRHPRLLGMATPTRDFYQENGFQVPTNSDPEGGKGAAAATPQHTRFP